MDNNNVETTLTDVIVIKLNNDLELRLTKNARFDEGVRQRLQLEPNEPLLHEHYVRFLLNVVKGAEKNVEIEYEEDEKSDG